MQHPAHERALAVVAPATSGPPIVPRDALARVTRLALGAAGLAISTLQALMERSMPADSDPGGASRLPKPAQVPLPSAAIGLGLEAQRRSLRMAAALSARLGPAVSIVVHPVASRGPLAAVWRRLDMDGWSARGLAEQRRNELAAAAFLSELLSVVLAGVLERVDLNAVVARVDLNAVVAGVDLNRVVERLDLDAIVARVDIDAVLRRVDLAAVTEQVIDEVDVGRVIRESSSAMTSETVDTLRVQGMQVDQVLSRIVDRVLLRKGERQTGLGQAPTGEVDP